MTFSSLDDAYEAFVTLDKEKDTLLGIIKAQQVVLSALIQTHHNHNNFQLYLSRVQESAALGKLPLDLGPVDGNAYEKVIAMYSSLPATSQAIDPFYGQKIFPDSKQS